MHVAVANLTGCVNPMMIKTTFSITLGLYLAFSNKIILQKCILMTRQQIDKRFLSRNSLKEIFELPQEVNALQAHCTACTTVVVGI